MALGGPAGAFVGMGLGAGLKAISGEPDKSGKVKDLQLRFRSVPDEAGVFYRIWFPNPLPTDTLGLASVIDDRNKRLGAYAPFADRNGFFCAGREIQSQQTDIYVPYAALRYEELGLYEINVSVISRMADGPRCLGMGRIGIDLPAPAVWRPGLFLEPLIALCMVVARTEGHPSAKKLRTMQDFFVKNFKLIGPDVSDLRQVMKRRLPPQPEGLIQRVTRRFPAMEPQAIVRLLGEIARSDSPITPDEAHCIKRVAVRLGVNADRWSAMSDGLELGVMSHCKVLGVPKDASVDEIKKAYRALIRQYHPDRVASLPVEFRQLAEKKSKELREAYEGLLKHAQERE